MRSPTRSVGEARHYEAGGSPGLVSISDEVTLQVETVAELAC